MESGNGAGSGTCQAEEKTHSRRNRILGLDLQPPLQGHRLALGSAFPLRLRQTISVGAAFPVFRGSRHLFRWGVCLGNPRTPPGISCVLADVCHPAPGSSLLDLGDSGIHGSLPLVRDIQWDQGQSHDSQEFFWWKGGHAGGQHSGQTQREPAHQHFKLPTYFIWLYHAYPVVSQCY